MRDVRTLHHSFNWPRSKQISNSYPGSFLLTLRSKDHSHFPNHSFVVSMISTYFHWEHHQIPACAFGSWDLCMLLACAFVNEMEMDLTVRPNSCISVTRKKGGNPTEITTKPAVAQLYIKNINARYFQHKLKWLFWFLVNFKLIYHHKGRVFSKKVCVNALWCCQKNYLVILLTTLWL